MPFHSTDVHVGKKIREFRHLQGLTQTQLAEKIGVKFQQLQKYETGMNRVSASRLFTLAEVLGVAVSSFFPQQKMIPLDADPTIEVSRSEAQLIRALRNFPEQVRAGIEALIRAL